MRSLQRIILAAIFILPALGSLRAQQVGSPFSSPRATLGVPVSSQAQITQGGPLQGLPSPGGPAQSWPAQGIPVQGQDSLSANSALSALHELLPAGCVQTWSGPSEGMEHGNYAALHNGAPHGFGNSVPSNFVSTPEMYGHGKQVAVPVSVATMGDTVAAAPEDDPHKSVFLNDRYPSALACAKCHPRHFEEWRVSAHAYSVVSPMFQRFEQTLTELSRGTVGAFCTRCHSPVAVQESIPRYASLLDSPAVVREGITCVACHRVVETYGKTHGSRRIEPGDIYQPVVGTSDGSGLASALRDKNTLKLKTSSEDKGQGQDIHNGRIRFETLSRSDFCLSCHQVAVHPGIWLEVVYSQYQAGPAKAKGITCQDCHMGAVPGKPDGYECQHISELSGKPYGEPRKYSSHMFWGPGYSIAHPGLFPIDEKGERWSPREWLQFDWQAQWGTEAFERALDELEANGRGTPLHFPAPWDNADERRDARQVLDSKFKSLAKARAGSIAAMEAGSAINGPFFGDEPHAGEPLRFHYVVSNVSEGHNLPTGSLGAQPQVWLNVALVNPHGQTVWESGYLDTQGDLADMHSEDVANGVVPRDSQLFNLQTKFLITNVKGTDREVALPVNFDVDQNPFLRPATIPVSVLNHPPLIRMEAHSIPPLDSKKAHYKIPAKLMQEPGVYRLDVRLRSRVEPSYFMRLVKSTPEMINRMNHQTLDVHTQTKTFYVR